MCHQWCQKSITSPSCGKPQDDWWWFYGFRWQSTELKKKKKKIKIHEKHKEAFILRFLLDGNEGVFGVLYNSNNRNTWVFSVPDNSNSSNRSISHEIWAVFGLVLLGIVMVILSILGECLWCIYPYSLGPLHWCCWDSRMIAIRQHSITWTNIDLPSKVFCWFHLRTILQKVPMNVNDGWSCV